MQTIDFMGHMVIKFESTNLFELGTSLSWSDGAEDFMIFLTSQLVANLSKDRYSLCN